jgi:orotidine-5'-phosphate decarboxylase
MNSYKKINQIFNKTNNGLTIGIDPDISKLPKNISKDIDGIYEFSKSIIENTKDITAAYKINFAFFENFGSKGFQAIENLMQIIPENVFTIADAKRSDIGNSAKFYAKSVFEHFGFDSITVNPLMGRDSIDPFIEFDEKFVFLLGLTSNSGADDFLKKELTNQNTLFQEIISKTSEWYSKENVGYVVGATQSNLFAKIRQIIPNHLLLVPGIGTQGGDLDELKRNGLFPALINVSRDIIFTSIEDDYVQKIYVKAIQYANSLQIK